MNAVVLSPIAAVLATLLICGLVGLEFCVAYRMDRKEARRG